MFNRTGLLMALGDLHNLRCIRSVNNTLICAGSFNSDAYPVKGEVQYVLTEDFKKNMPAAGEKFWDSFFKNLAVFRKISKI